MGTRFPSYQLSNGLYVSGVPEPPKEKTPTISSVAGPYTGGDVRNSGELGKMFAIPPNTSKCRKSGPFITHSGPLNTHTAARASYSTSDLISSMGALKKSHSGPLSKHGEPIKKSSGLHSGVVTPMNRQNSSPILPTTGLITSGPISLNQSVAPRKPSGPQDASGPMKLHGPSSTKNLAVTTVGQAHNSWSFVKNLPRAISCAVVMLFLMGFMAGGFILGAVENAIVLVVVTVFFFLLAALFVWNYCWARRAAIGYITSYPDSDLRAAKNGQLVKITGVVTCGNVPLKSSFQNFPRCVFTSTSLHEYRAWGSKPATPTQRCFTWALTFSEKHAVDFYISDFQTGLRALVKAGYGARVMPYVDEKVAIDVDPSEDTSPEFLRWLREKSLCLEDRPMRLKEEYVKEGSTVSVMGVVQRNENTLMIVAPTEPISTGCLWPKCTFPASFDGLVLRCEDTSKVEVIAV